MRVGERSRAVARTLWIALAVSWTGLPLGAGAGQPDAIVADDRSSIPSATHSVPLPRIIQPSARAGEPFALPVAGWSSAEAAKWREITFALDHDRDTLAACRNRPHRCPPAARQFLAIVAAAQGRQGRARLGEVNRSLNLAIRYQTDARQHGVADAWASPLATLSSGRGDCEDFAIAKYLALREAGVAPGDLRFVVVRDARHGQEHAVLTARLDDRWLVLDNRRLVLVEDRESRDYVAVAAFGEDASVVVAADNRESVPENALQPAIDAARPQPGPL
jgi:predicted transglutaminase-like cysteine proteinase